MRTAIFVLCLSAAAWAQQAALRQEDPRLERGTKAKAKESPVEISGRGGLGFSYDDNILDLSGNQLDQFEDGTKPEKYRISEEHDLVSSGWVELELRTRALGSPTTFEFQARAHAYQENSFANYEEYALAVKQDLGKNELGLEYGAEVDVYDREIEIVVPGPNLWESGYFTQHELEAYYRLRLAPWAGVRPFAGYALRDFESPFGYRDLEGHFLGIRPALEAGPWSLSLQYRYRSMEADAGDLEPDTSYREHSYEPALTVELLDKRVELSVRHRWAFREFTSSNSPAIDPNHLDREDIRRRLLIEGVFKAHRRWTVEARYVRREVDSEQPYDAGDSGEEGSSERNIFTLGVAYNF